MSDLLARLTVQLDELTRAHVERTAYHVWRNRNRQQREHAVVVASLLDQLRARARAAAAPDVGRFRGGFGPSGPSMGPVDVLARVERGAVDLLGELGVRVRAGGVEDLLGQVRAAAASLPDCPGRDRCPGCDLELAAAAVRSWWVVAMVETAWHDRAREIRSPCPACGELALWARAFPLAAWCVECWAGWDEWTIGLLADHARQNRTVPLTHTSQATERETDEA